MCVCACVLLLLLLLLFLLTVCCYLPCLHALLACLYCTHVGAVAEVNHMMACQP